MTDTPASTREGHTGDGVGRIDRRPTPLSSGLAVVAAASTAIASAYAPLALVSGLVGLLALVVGLAVGRQAAVTVGAGTLVVGVIAAGVSGAPVLATLVGTMSALLAFDFATTALGLGEQLGRGAPTAAVELLHAATSTLVGLGVVIVAFGLHEVAVGDQPVSAVLGLLLVVVFLVAALRRSDPTPGRPG